MILVVDNYDSFVYNLVQYIGACGAEVVVRRNDQITPSEIAELRPAGILLSPGPCTPDRSGVCVPLLEAALGSSPPDWLQIPIFGVCLGHQAMGMVAGNTVGQAPTIRHGKQSMVKHDGRGWLSGMPNPFKAVRYHSLAILGDQPPAGFEVTARAIDDDTIMAIRHIERPIEGVQFHPESILTENGIQIIRNFVAATV